jgi:hypothetical protein
MEAAFINWSNGTTFKFKIYLITASIFSSLTVRPEAETSIAR